MIWDRSMADYPRWEGEGSDEKRIMRAVHERLPVQKNQPQGDSVQGRPDKSHFQESDTGWF